MGLRMRAIVGSGLWVTLEKVETTREGFEFGSCASGIYELFTGARVAFNINGFARVEALPLVDFLAGYERTLDASGRWVSRNRKWRDVEGGDPKIEQNLCDLCGEPRDDCVVEFSDTGARVCEDCSGDGWVCSNSLCNEVFTVEPDDAIHLGDAAGLVCSEECAESMGYVECDRSQCGEWVQRYNAVKMSDGDVWCQSCFEDHGVTCSDCGDGFHIDDVRTDCHGTSYCERCSEERLLCSECEEWTDDGGWCPECDRCQSCCECSGSVVLHQNGYAPSSWNRGYVLGETSENRLKQLGYELEVDGGKMDDFEGLGEFQDAEHTFLCSDGSLSNQGIEFITHPATLASHKNGRRAVYEDFVKKARAAGYKSHDHAACGLHVHMDRRWLTEKGWMRYEYFVLRHESKMTKLARRSSSYAVFGKKVPIKRAHGQTELGKSNGSRYSALNFQNASTVEMRIFRGTLHVDTIIASLELCHAIAGYVQDRTFMEVHRGGWGAFKEHVAASPSEYAELIAYMNKVAA